MEDNNMNVTNEETVEIVPEENTTVVEKTTGLTAGQKGLGLTVIGFAIFGIVQLVRLAIKGGKWLYGKVFGKKKTEEEALKEEKKDDTLPVTEVSDETMDEIQKK